MFIHLGKRSAKSVCCCIQSANWTQNTARGGLDSCFCVRALNATAPEDRLQAIKES